MAKMLKHLVFGLKKNPPAPPRPDYEAERLGREVVVDFDALPIEEVVPPDFFGPDYENIPRKGSKGQVQFAVDKKEVAQPDLLVFDNYSEPADLRPSTLPKEEEDPLYMSPLDDRGTAPPLPQEEDMYCLPYDDATPSLPQSCMLHHPPQGIVLLHYSSFLLSPKRI